MARDLRRWDDDCVDELCDIVFGQFLLGNFVVRPPREPLWDVITNVLYVCNMDMQFIYVHARSEGSANNSQVLEEAIGDPKHGFP